MTIQNYSNVINWYKTGNQYIPLVEDCNNSLLPFDSGQTISGVITNSVGYLVSIPAPRLLLKNNQGVTVHDFGEITVYTDEVFQFKYSVVLPSLPAGIYYLYLSNGTASLQSDFIMLNLADKYLSFEITNNFDLKHFPFLSQNLTLRFNLLGVVVGVSPDKTSTVIDDRDSPVPREYNVTTKTTMDYLLYSLNFDQYMGLIKLLSAKVKIQGEWHQNFSLSPWTANRVGTSNIQLTCQLYSEYNINRN